MCRVCNARIYLLHIRFPELFFFSFDNSENISNWVLSILSLTVHNFSRNDVGPALLKTLVLKNVKI